MEPIEEFKKKQAETLIANFQRRRIGGYYFPTVKEAKEFIYSSLLKKGDSIGFGGSMTFEKETNLYSELKNNPDYHLIDRYDQSLSQEELNARTINADVFFLSANAISLDGQLVNIDGRGNRTAFLIYGPKSVVVIASSDKIMPDLPSAVLRARNIASPANAIRLNKNTPCVRGGRCYDCVLEDCICADIVLTRLSKIPNRIKVVLVGEKLGY
jgi:hypothetical protein